MKIGYSWHGFLGDKLSDSAKDTPDGNAAYSFSIILDLAKRGYDIFGMMENRDAKCFKQFKYKIFNSFASNYRKEAYDSIKWVKRQGNEIVNPPKLDYLLLEWRFPIPGRNTLADMGADWFQPDLIRQQWLLTYYLNFTDTKIVIMDLDYKLEIEDEKYLEQWKDRILVLETAIKPKSTILKRKSVFIPFIIDDKILIDKKEFNTSKELCYVGSRYERDNAIEKYLISYSTFRKYKIWFYGNWYKTLKQILNEKEWYWIQYHKRIGHGEFFEAYGDATACPLIAKDAYFKNGFMTARIIEALIFGCVPIGFSEHAGIEKFLPKELIARNYADLVCIVKRLQTMPVSVYNNYRKKIFNNLKFMDASNFNDAYLCNN